MPENSAIHHEQEQLAQFSRRDISIESSSSTDESIQDIGELLGFRVTGGRDFFMPITIFHVSNYLSHINVIVMRSCSMSHNR